MDFLIEGERVTPEPIDSFRETYQLPKSFSIRQFAQALPYNLIWSSQGTLENAGKVARQAVPQTVTAEQLPFQVDVLVAVFRTQIVQQAVPYKISVEEIEQVTEHLRDFLLAPVYRLIELDYTYRTTADRVAQIRANFDMTEIYHRVLRETAQLDYAGQPYEAPAPHRHWLVRPIHNMFGPAGLEIELSEENYVYAADSALALPAAPYLQAISIDLGNRLLDSFIR